jgi:hypothetical protein
MRQAAGSGICSAARIVQFFAMNCFGETARSAAFDHMPREHSLLTI